VISCKPNLVDVQFMPDQECHERKDETG
jgi:hypothetical protein